jgi:hypothetical protein
LWSAFCASCKKKELRTVKVLEVCQLDALAHAEDVAGAAEAVQGHPDVTRVQGGDLVAGGRAGVAGESVLDICPCSDEGREDHETEGEEGGSGDAAAEPQNLTVGDQDDGQVLENGVDGNGEVLQRLGRRVDHADEEKGDGEPCAGSELVLALSQQQGLETYISLLRPC